MEAAIEYLKKEGFVFAEIVDNESIYLKGNIAVLIEPADEYNTAWAIGSALRKGYDWNISGIDGNNYLVDVFEEVLDD